MVPKKIFVNFWDLQPKAWKMFLTLKRAFYYGPRLGHFFFLKLKQAEGVREGILQARGNQ